MESTQLRQWTARARVLGVKPCKTLLPQRGALPQGSTDALNRSGAHGARWSQQCWAQKEGLVTDKGQKVALVFELEGCVVDIHMDGHRQAFNKAFENLGWECVQWPVHIYHDLLTTGDGSPETLVRTYFTMMGWPTMLATSEQPGFIKKVCAEKQAALAEMLRSGSVPLRSGVKEVIVDAVKAGATVAWIAGTRSESSDLVVSNALAQLPEEVGQVIRVFSSGVVRQQRPSQQDGEQGSANSGGVPGGDAEGDQEQRPGHDQLRRRQALQKQAQAQTFVAGMMAGDANAPISVHPSLMALDEARLSPEWLAAVSATLGVPLGCCILLGSSATTTEAGATAGMIPVAMPRRMAERGVFPGASAKFGGYGHGEATFSRLKSLVHKASTPVQRPW